MALLRSHRSNALMGLALEGRQLEGIVLRRANDKLELTQWFRTSLALDPLTNEPELVGREIRNHLDEAGIRESRCAVCIPLQWALTLQSKLPDLPEPDMQSLLNIEAERGFPFAPEDLAISTSRFRAPNGDQHALLVAVPKGHLTLLERALKAARLKPISFSLGIAALEDIKEDAGTGVLTLVVGGTSIEMQVSINGGLVALRIMEGAVETEDTVSRFDAGLIAREIRITLGQLPKELRDAVSRIKVFGRAELTQPLIRQITPLARDMGLQVQIGTTPRIDGYDAHEQNSGSATPALSLAARHLAGTPPGFEFLPPRLSPWTQAVARFSSRKIVSAGAVAGVVLFMVCGALLWQHWRLNRLEARWNAVRPKIEVTETLQQKSKQFGPWFDDSLKGLRILRRLTEAFPEDGAVSVKTLQIKDLAEVTCGGQARDNQALLRMLDRLRETPQITDLKMQQVRGKAPLQYNLSFRWKEGLGHDH